MMYLLAKDIDKLDENTHEGPSNVAIAIIDEPTFVGKSTALLAFLRSRLSSFSLPFSSGTPTLRLTFLLGLDTLERLFSPRYYPSEESMLKSLRYFFGPDEGSSIVCARRDPSSYPSSPPLTTGTEEPRIPQTATEFILANQITLIDIGVDEQAFSSAQVRRLRSSSDEWKKMASGRIGKYIEENGMYLE
jgi:nicotinamide-nucleotide adenylyltransferase